MNYRVGKSSKVDFREAIVEATSGLVSPKLILYFSDVPHFEKYTKGIKDKFKDSIIIGATTYAGFCKDGAYKNTLVVIGIEDGIECYANVLEEADKYPLKYVHRIEECVNKFQDVSNAVCFEISSSLVSCEELVLSTFNSVLGEKNIPLFGGSSGDEKGRAEKTMISFNGKVYDNACAFVIIKNLGGKIKLYRENIYKPTGHYFTATKVDVRNRTVYEYDNKPAAKVFAQALNTTVEGITNDQIDSYPLGRIVGDEMYITANKMVAKNNGMEYHAKVYKNSKMALLEPDDYRNVISKTMKKVKADIPNPSLSIMVHCLARSILFDKEGYINEFARNMSSVLGDYIGFSGYGEQLNQQHFNQTMVIAVFE